MSTNAHVPESLAGHNALMKWVADADLALIVLGLEALALACWALAHWARNWGDADAVVISVAGPILLVVAGVGFLRAGKVITGIAEILAAVVGSGFLAYKNMRLRDLKRRQWFEGR